MGTIRGIPIGVHPSVMIIGFFYSLYYSQIITGMPVAVYILTFVAMTASLFGGILLHELGHSVMAQRYGIEVASINLMLFGGVASMARAPKRSGEAFAIAIAGPIVSFIIGLPLLALAMLGPFGGTLIDLIFIVGATHTVLGVFNLLPILPLDGGRMAHAGIWKLCGNQHTATIWLFRAGAFFLTVYIANWLRLVLSGMFPFPPYIAIFVFAIGYGEYRRARVERLREQFAFADQ